MKNWNKLKLWAKGNNPEPPVSQYKLLPCGAVFFWGWTSSENAITWHHCPLTTRANEIRSTQLHAATDLNNPISGFLTSFPPLPANPRTTAFFCFERRLNITQKRSTAVFPLVECWIIDPTAHCLQSHIFTISAHLLKGSTYRIRSEKPTKEQ